MRLLAAALLVGLVYAPALHGQLQPSYASALAWLVVEHSRVYDAFRPWEREVKFAAADALSWEVADYRETILLYFRLLYDAVLHNRMDRAARYLAALSIRLWRTASYNSLK